MNKSSASGGIGNYRRGEVLTDLNVSPGQLLVYESIRFKSTNLIKVTETFKDKFYAVFVNPTNPAEKKRASDEEFVVYTTDLKQGEYYVALEPAPNSVTEEKPEEVPTEAKEAPVEKTPDETLADSPQEGTVGKPTAEAARLAILKRSSSNNFFIAEVTLTVPDDFKSVGDELTKLVETEDDTYDLSVVDVSYKFHDGKITFIVSGSVKHNVESDLEDQLHAMFVGLLPKEVSDVDSVKVTSFGKIEDEELMDELSEIEENALSFASKTAVKITVKVSDAGTIADYDDKEGYLVVSDSQDVALIKENFGNDEQVNEFDSFLVKYGDGDYEDVLGFWGIIPRLEKRVSRIELVHEASKIAAKEGYSVLLRMPDTGKSGSDAMRNRIKFEAALPYVIFDILGDGNEYALVPDDKMDNKNDRSEMIAAIDSMGWSNVLYSDLFKGKELIDSKNRDKPTIAEDIKNGLKKQPYELTEKDVGKILTNDSKEHLFSGMSIGDYDVGKRVWFDEDGVLEVESVKDRDNRKKAIKNPVKQTLDYGESMNKYAEEPADAINPKVNVDEPLKEDEIPNVFARLLNPTPTNNVPLNVTKAVKVIAKKEYELVGFEPESETDEDGSFFNDEVNEEDIQINENEYIAYYAGKPIVDLSNKKEETIDVFAEPLKNWMDKNGYYPSIVTINDHGNVTHWSIREKGTEDFVREDVLEPKDTSYRGIVGSKETSLSRLLANIETICSEEPAFKTKKKNVGGETYVYLDQGKQLLPIGRYEKIGYNTFKVESEFLGYAGEVTSAKEAEQLIIDKLKSGIETLPELAFLKTSGTAGGEGDDGSAYDLTDGNRNFTGVDETVLGSVVDEFLTGKAISIASFNEFSGVMKDMYGLSKEHTASLEDAWINHDKLGLVASIKKNATKDLLK